MDAKRCDLVFAPIFLGLFLLLASQTEAEAAVPYKKFVDDLCKSTSDPQFCASTVLSDPTIRNVNNTNDVARVAFAIAKRKSLATSKIFDGLSQQNGAAYKPALQTCAAQFKSAASCFDPRVVGSDEASLDVHYALDECEICETVMGKAKITIESALRAVADWRRIYSVAYDAAVATETTLPPPELSGRRRMR